MTWWKILQHRNSKSWPTLPKTFNIHHFPNFILNENDGRMSLFNFTSETYYYKYFHEQSLPGACLEFFECFWLVEANFEPIRSSTQIQVLTLHKSMEFLCLFLRHHILGKLVVASWNIGCCLSLVSKEDPVSLLVVRC